MFNLKLYMQDIPIIQENIRLAPFTTMQVGGPARYFIEARNQDDVIAALGFAERKDLPVLILGGGSNLLISDKGFPGVVVRVSIVGVEWVEAGEVVFAVVGAGEDWDGFVKQCVERNLAGVECLSGIPGLVSGTPIQNVGAYGQEVSETIESVKVYDRHRQAVLELNNADCGFGYRSSIFNSTARDRYVVLSVTFRLKRNGSPAILYQDLKDHFSDHRDTPSLIEVREAVRSIRNRKAMLIVPGDPDCRSAGSFFKNPVVTMERYDELVSLCRDMQLINQNEQVPHFDTAEGLVKVPAAWLIERAGFQKGYRKGRAGISSKHTLAIVNIDGASAGDILELVMEIQSRVEKMFGIMLNPEPVFVNLPCRAMTNDK